MEVWGNSDGAIFVKNLYRVCNPIVADVGCHPFPGWFLSTSSEAGISMTDGVGRLQWW